MYSKSNYVKSKKQKMNEKRYQKYRPQERKHSLHRRNPPVQVIVDSESPSSQSIELVQVRRKPNEQRQKVQRKEEIRNSNHQTKFNNFNMDRIKKAPVNMRVGFTAATLNVSECLEGIESQENNRVISYKKVGAAAKKTVCENYLKTRLENIPEQAQLASKVTLEVDEDDKGEKNNQSKQQVKAAEPVKPAQQKVRRRAPRYFDEELSDDSEQKDQELEDDEQTAKKSVKCFRCGQKGHIARLCNQRQILKCQYCLGPHHTSDCTDRLCHRCNEKGHIKQNCRSEKIQCRKCRMHGHIAKNCGKILMMNYSADRQKQIRERYETEDLQKLKCLKCNGHKNSKGHFNCQEYSRKIPRIYDEPYIIL